MDFPADAASTTAAMPRKPTSSTQAIRMDANNLRRLMRLPRIGQNFLRISARMPKFVFAAALRI